MLPRHDGGPNRLLPPGARNSHRNGALAPRLNSEAPQNLTLATAHNLTLAAALAAVAGEGRR